MNIDITQVAALGEKVPDVAAVAKTVETQTKAATEILKTGESIIGSMEKEQAVVNEGNIFYRTGCWLYEKASSFYSRVSSWLFPEENITTKESNKKPMPRFYKRVADTNVIDRENEVESTTTEVTNVELMLLDDVFALSKQSLERIQNSMKHMCNEIRVKIMDLCQGGFLDTDCFVEINEVLEETALKTFTNFEQTLDIANAFGRRARFLSILSEETSIKEAQKKEIAFLQEFKMMLAAKWATFDGQEIGSDKEEMINYYCKGEYTKNSKPMVFVQLKKEVALEVFKKLVFSTSNKNQEKLLKTFVYASESWHEVFLMHLANAIQNKPFKNELMECAIDCASEEISLFTTDGKCSDFSNTLYKIARAG